MGLHSDFAEQRYISAVTFEAMMNIFRLPQDDDGNGHGDEHGYEYKKDMEIYTCSQLTGVKATLNIRMLIHFML